MLVTMTNTLQNAFSDRLGRFGFNIFCALVVDLLHEFEIGVWKMLFVHLLRIVEVQDKGLIDELDRRYVTGIHVTHSADPPY
jgi:hypothetical protein